MSAIVGIGFVLAIVAANLAPLMVVQRSKYDSWREWWNG